MRRKPPIVGQLEDLPGALQQQVASSGIDTADVAAHFDSFLNALHIRTKERFYTREGFERMKYVTQPVVCSRNRDTRARYKRRNLGASTVSVEIVSTAALQKEHKDLVEPFKEGDYTFMKKLGKGKFSGSLFKQIKGGFGHVFLAEEKKTKEKVAVKKMPHMTEKQQRKNFQEVRFLKYCTSNAARGIVEFRRAAIISDEVRENGPNLTT